MMFFINVSGFWQRILIIMVKTMTIVITFIVSLFICNLPMSVALLTALRKKKQYNVRIAVL